MQQKADAYEQYGQAAVIDLLAQVLPEVVRAASEPLAGIDKMTVISTDGASEVTRNVASSVAQAMQMVTDLTGVQMSELIGGLADRAAGRPTGDQNAAAGLAAKASRREPAEVGAASPTGEK